MQNMGKIASESFAEAIKLDPQNACEFCVKTKVGLWKWQAEVCFLVPAILYSLPA